MWLADRGKGDETHTASLEFDWSQHYYHHDNVTLSLKIFTDDSFNIENNEMEFE